MGEDIQKVLEAQDRRKVNTFVAAKLENDAKKNWDIFYKRNEDRFFKDRNWVVKEFLELVSACGAKNADEATKIPIVLFEIGCGSGNFFYPLLQQLTNLRIIACDFSPRAVDIIRSHHKYDESKINVFVCDITEEFCFDTQAEDIAQADFISLIFVLSSISPEKHTIVVNSLAKRIKPGALIFFRDYGLHDMTQLRFKGGKKIAENFYVRRDGTRSYFFRPQEVTALFSQEGLLPVECDYLYRRTVNPKENIDVKRTFVQARFIKSDSSFNFQKT